MPHTAQVAVQEALGDMLALLLEVQEDCTAVVALVQVTTQEPHLAVALVRKDSSSSPTPQREPRRITVLSY